MKIIILESDNAEALITQFAQKTGFDAKEVAAAIHQMSSVFKQPPLPTAEDLAEIGERISFVKTNSKEEKTIPNPASRKFKNGRF